MCVHVQIMINRISYRKLIFFMLGINLTWVKLWPEMFRKVLRVTPWEENNNICAYDAE